MKYFLIIFFLLLSLNVSGQEIPSSINNRGEMVLIPEGEFIMGTDREQIKSTIGLLGGCEEWYILEYPKHRVNLPSYYIDKYEVTNKDYCEFLNKAGNQEEEKGVFYIKITSSNCLLYQDQKGMFKPKKGYEKYPVILVSWYGAQAYAKWAGKRIPTEAEWEKAARGTKGWFWPWGNSWDKDKCNNWKMKKKNLIKLMPDIYDGRGPLPGGSFPEGASIYGAMDMTGNVAEWCADWYGVYPGYPYYAGDNYYEFTHKVTRGGSWGIDIPGGLRCATRSIHRSYAPDPYTGFRCCMDIKN